MRRTLRGWLRDLTQATRSLLRAPGFTVVTVATLALAIGSNTAIFSVVDAVLLDPLPFPNADRLVAISASAPGSDLPEEFGAAPEFYVQYSEGADLLEDVGLYDTYQTTVRTEDRTDRLFGAFANPSFYTTLGARPVLGRLPTPDDDPFTAVVISHWLWEDWFSSDPAAIGRSVEVSGNPVTVIGVLGPEFRFLDERTAFWVHAMLGDPAEIEVGEFGYGIIGRMRPGTSHEDLSSQLTILARRLPERFGGSAEYARTIEQHRPVVRSLAEELVGDIAGPLWLLLGTTAIVLLIACANVANLFMVRAESRRQDLAVRRALGAGRAGLVRTQMAEALLLAAAAGALGALLAWAAIRLLVRAAPENIPNLDLVGLNLTGLAFTAGISILAAFIFGLFPALRFSDPALGGGLRQAGGIGQARGHWGRNALVVVQTASALVLLVGAGLLVRSFLELTRVDPGYDTEDIFTFQIAPDRPTLDDGPSFARFHQAFMDRVAALPGVESVGLTNWLPLDEGAGSNRFSTERTEITGETPPPMRFTFVGGDYFRTMRIELVMGRLFDSRQLSEGGNAVVSRVAAERLWPGEDPIGQRFRLDEESTDWLIVVGLVEDIMLEDFRQEEVDPMIYLPMAGPSPDSWAIGSPAYVVKSSRAVALAPEIRTLVRELAPEAPMYRVFTMEQLADRSMARLSLTMLLLAITAGLALILGAIGLYGVLSYVVSQRTRELAVRMALGAEAPGVQRMVVAQGVRVTLVGVLLGLLAALALTRVLESLLFGVGALDLSTFGAMAALMLGIAVLASYIPARRASSVDPMQSLRVE